MSQHGQGEATFLSGSIPQSVLILSIINPLHKPTLLPSDPPHNCTTLHRSKQQRKPNINNITLNLLYISFLAKIRWPLFKLSTIFTLFVFFAQFITQKKHHPTNLLSRQQEFMWSMSQEAFCHTAISSVVIVGQNRSSDIASIFLWH